MASTWKLPDPEENSDKALAAAGPEDPVNKTLAKPMFTRVAVNSDDTVTVSWTGLSRSREASLKKLIRGIDFGGLVVTEWAVGTPSNASWQPNAFASWGLNPDGLVRVEKGKGIVVKRTAQLSANAKPAIYVVIGSFRDKVNAERFGAEHARFKTTISRVASDGRTMFRLLAGPIERKALKDVRADDAKAGIRNSWAVRLCRTSLSVPPCRSPVQQAALP